MKKFKICKTFANTLTGTIEAENEAEANEIFDNMTEDELTENYIGLVSSEHNCCTEVKEK